MSLQVPAPIRNPQSAIPNRKLAGLYIHIPFCRTKCPYCNFYSQTDLSVLPDFIEGLDNEMRMAAQGFGGPFDTVYIGGGTPSVLSPGQMEKILAGVQEHFRLAPETEFTLEANPGDVDLPYLHSLKKLGLTRLNLGVQSFDPQALAFLGRRHTAQQAVKAIHASRKAGFDHLGLDFIYGLPGQTPGSWLDTLDRAMEFSPEHLSCYQLTFEDETPMGKSCRRGNILPRGEDELFRFFMSTSERLENAGFIHYEVSNFARGLSYASRHNQKYWDHTPYLGLGPSAHSFSGSTRWWNSRSVKTYLTRLQSENLPVEEKENLTREQLRLEAWFLGLRTSKGIDREDFSARYGEASLSRNAEVLARLREKGLLTDQDGRLRPTRAGLAVADTLALL
jgi:oxygen-independent coproporphyrinogen III oxidase